MLLHLDISHSMVVLYKRSNSVINAQCELNVWLLYRCSTLNQSREPNVVNVSTGLVKNKVYELLFHYHDRKIYRIWFSDWFRAWNEPIEALNVRNVTTALS